MFYICNIMRPRALVLRYAMAAGTLKIATEKGWALSVDFHGCFAVVDAEKMEAITVWRNGTDISNQKTGAVPPITWRKAATQIVQGIP